MKKMKMGLKRYENECMALRKECTCNCLHVLISLFKKQPNNQKNG